MPDLVAQGQQRQHRWRRRLPVDEKVTLGRTAGAWAVPWDDHISRRHAEIVWRNGSLQVSVLPSARNPVFLRGGKMQQFSITPGEHFVIGGTTFALTDEKANVSLDVPHPATEQTFSPAYLQGVRFRDADQRIEVLGRLPEIISGAGDDNELCVRLVNLLLAGTPSATAVAIVALGIAADGDSRVDVLHWDRRSLIDEDFQPSERLIRQAIQGGESIVHLWGEEARLETDFTLSENISWAFCTPVPGDSCRGWAIYVAGGPSRNHHQEAAATSPHDLRDDLKFTELAATTLGNLRELRQLERSQTSLRQFFSPLVLDAIADADPEDVLAPREARVSVLFCDLRGFSRASEKAAHDLLGLLQRVSQALGVLTRLILQHGGVVGDFHGDAAMGFWGWPLQHADTATRACRAALAVRAEIASAAGHHEHPMSDFRMGIGIATGPAVAGKIGTVDQVKVTVFGPVVNLASRLEGMTKTLRGQILIDDQTARYVRDHVPREVARVRRLAVVRPFGMDRPLEVSELLPSEAEFPQLSDQHLATYESALAALRSGDWTTAMQRLHQLPAEDQAKDFLTVFIAKHDRVPPADWDGVISLASK